MESIDTNPNSMIEQRHRQVIQKVYPDLEILGSQNYIHQNLKEFFLKSDSLKTVNFDVLDIGCGHCSKNLEPFQDLINLTGIDLDEEAINRHTWLKEKYIGSCENLPFEDNSFDVIFGRYSFEHFSNKEQAISEISRVLRPYGMCILLTVNRHALEFMIAKIFRSKIRSKIKNILMQYPEIDTYETNYLYNDEKEITTLLAKNGLKVQLPIHLVSTTSGFMRRFIILCYFGAFYSRAVHQFNFRRLMSQMTAISIKQIV